MLVIQKIETDIKSFCFLYFLSLEKFCAEIRTNLSPEKEMFNKAKERAYNVHP